MSLDTSKLEKIVLEPTTTKHILLYYDGPMITIEQNGKNLWYQFLVDDDHKKMIFVRIRINEKMETELVKRYDAEDDSAKWENIEELLFSTVKPLLIIEVLNDGSECGYIVESFSKVKEAYDNW